MPEYNNIELIVIVFNKIDFECTITKMIINFDTKQKEKK